MLLVSWDATFDSHLSAVALTGLHFLYLLNKTISSQDGHGRLFTWQCLVLRTKQSSANRLHRRLLCLWSATCLADNVNTSVSADSLY